MKPPIFLERQTYRRRRYSDMARLLPVLGLFLFMLPLLGDDETESGMAVQLAYVFGVWVVLIICALLLARRLQTSASSSEDPKAEDGNQ